MLESVAAYDVSTLGLLSLKQLNKELESAINAALLSAQAAGSLPRFDVPAIPVSPPKRAEQGDLSYPAMGLARLARKSPLDIAKLIVAGLNALEFVDSIEIAPPGFINFSLADDYLKRQVDAIIAEGENFFQLDIGLGKTAQVEFVSANPSGPITIGHTRGAVVGDAMARLLEASGYQVQREYYYNNAGQSDGGAGQELDAALPAAAWRIGGIPGRLLSRRISRGCGGAAGR